jgi:hypothetical protein
VNESPIRSPGLSTFTRRFPGNQFTGKITPAIESGGQRPRSDIDGAVTTLEIGDLDAQIGASFMFYRRRSARSPSLRRR